jgi:hypothetical protein
VPAMERELKLVKRHVSSRIEEGAAILNCKGPRIPMDTHPVEGAAVLHRLPARHHRTQTGDR